MKKTILIIDDEKDYIFLTGEFLKTKGFTILIAANSEQAFLQLKKNQVDVILLDIILNQESGLNLISQIKEKSPHSSILMNTCLNDTSSVVQAMKQGASDYCQKGIDNNQLLDKIQDLIQMNQAIQTKEKLQKNKNLQKIIGSSPQTKALINEVSRISQSDATIFIRGETGVGKSHIAKLIHDHSHRKEQNFVTINCATIPKNLLESELFGHVKGAFTGAVRDKKGKFELAHKGTIFLDEIGELPLDLQVKILQVLQAQEFEKVGGLETIKVDVRVIAATNRDIEEALQNKSFRQDLFYRLNVLPLFIPPLRDRKQDIQDLTKHYLHVFSKKHQKSFHNLDQAIIDQLYHYNWPGNIRELQNVIERAVIVTKGQDMTFADFQNLEKSLQKISDVNNQNLQPINSVWDIEYQNLIKALQNSGGNMTQAAKILGIGRNTLYNRLRKYSISTKAKRQKTHSESKQILNNKF